MKQVLSKPKRKYENEQGGFVILYAILVSTVVVTIGLSLLTVLLQQTALSGAEKESTASFAAADSGLECALFADQVQDAFRTGLVSNCNGTVSCDGQVVNVSGATPASKPVPGQPGWRIWTCNLTVNLPQGNCAAIRVDKIIANATGVLATTTIQSRGYNTACPPAASTKPWRLERGLQAIY